MKVYTCDNCSNPLYFENEACLQCSYKVGFDPAKVKLITLIPNGTGQFLEFNNNQNIFRFCDNARYGVCNWLIPHSHSQIYCSACSLNRIIPALTDLEYRDRWKRIEIAKHRLVYSLLRLNLPFQAKAENQSEGLAFDFLANESSSTHVVTGHNEGVITLNIDEADEPVRARHKLNLGEHYRTLLGHFRHEIGHYYWNFLIKDQDAINNFRWLFGDEQLDYNLALKNYYDGNKPLQWSEDFISQYATAHPWEDWAESWAHYLHMMDTLEAAHSFGIGIHPDPGSQPYLMVAEINNDPYTLSSFDQIIEMWLPLTFAVNSLNRSMGHNDFYPFFLSPNVIKKLQFIHEVCFAISSNR